MSVSPECRAEMDSAAPVYSFFRCAVAVTVPCGEALRR